MTGATNGTQSAESDGHGATSARPSATGDTGSLSGSAHVGAVRADVGAVAIEYSATRKNLMMARLKAQAVLMQGAKRNRDNPFAKSKYATLESLLEAVAEPLTENGLLLTQWCGDVELIGPKADRSSMKVYTQIEHAETTEWMRVSMSIPIVKNDAQGIGSAFTYGRRYTLKGGLAIPEVDDDGAAASGQESDLRPKRKSSAEAKRDGTSDLFNEIKREIGEAINVEMLRHVGETRREQVEEMPDKWRELIRDEYELRLETLKARVP